MSLVSTLLSTKVRRLVQFIRLDDECSHKIAWRDDAALYVLDAMVRNIRCNSVVLTCSDTMFDLQRYDA